MSMAAQLRSTYEHLRVRGIPVELLLHAADHIERLEQQVQETREYFDEEDRRYAGR